MDDQLLSVGIDVGTTSTQMVVSRLRVQNTAGAFCVPSMQIVGREIVYQSPVYFTPLSGPDRVDGEALRKLLEKEYINAGIDPTQVDTGAVIITGETSRKENAKEVLHALAGQAGTFVVATAGAQLESVLAAKGAGAVACSETSDRPVLHMDIGGGTSNLALAVQGRIVATSCLNVGGRLIKVGESGTVSYISPVLKGLCKLSVGDLVSEQGLEDVAQVLVQALEMAAGLRPATTLLRQLTTQGCPRLPLCQEPVMVSFSGGVADCIGQRMPWDTYGDLGPVLGRAIRESLLCAQPYRLGEQTIRATVIGAGCHSARLSGSTVFYKEISFPLKNRPVVCLPRQEQTLPVEALAQKIRQRMDAQDTLAVLAPEGIWAADYASVQRLARGIGAGIPEGPILVALQQDMAKALGQALYLQNPHRPILCLDGLVLKDGDYLDVAAPVGPAVPVVVKTLVFDEEK